MSGHENPDILARLARDELPPSVDIADGDALTVAIDAAVAAVAATAPELIGGSNDGRNGLRIAGAGARSGGALIENKDPDAWIRGGFGSMSELFDRLTGELSPETLVLAETLELRIEMKALADAVEAVREQLERIKDIDAQQAEYSGDDEFRLYRELVHTRYEARLAEAKLCERTFSTASVNSAARSSSLSRSVDADRNAEADNVRAFPFAPVEAIGFEVKVRMARAGDEPVDMSFMIGLRADSAEKRAALNGFFAAAVAFRKAFVDRPG